jgi:broad specificity phosphatase PhoE
MPTLTLVRHGQASFNSDDYDRLSALGARQAQRLAAHWLHQGERFDVVVTGTLQRQQQTEQHLGAAFAEAGVAWPHAERHEGLNEFPAERVVRKLAPELCLRDRSVRRCYRRYARGGEDAEESLMELVQRVCEYWVREDYFTPLPVRWPHFRDQVGEVLSALSARAAAGERVLAITSGGVISVALSAVSGDPVEGAIASNWSIHNGSLTRFRALDGGGLAIDRRADIEHLDEALRTLR